MLNLFKCLGLYLSAPVLIIGTFFHVGSGHLVGIAYIIALLVWFRAAKRRFGTS